MYLFFVFNGELQEVQESQGHAIKNVLVILLSH